MELVKSLSFKSLGFIVKMLFELSHKFLSNIYNWNSKMYIKETYYYFTKVI